jgi:hypothetical protein
MSARPRETARRSGRRWGGGDLSAIGGGRWPSAAWRRQFSLGLEGRGEIEKKKGIDSCVQVILDSFI